MTEVEEMLQEALRRRREDAEYVAQLRRRAEQDEMLLRLLADAD